MAYELIVGDALEVMRGMQADSVSLCLFSPPYETARTYSIGFALSGEAWVEWMVKIFTECQRICTGLVACVCQGMTKKFRWSATPALLMADLHRAGFNLRNPPIFHRVGIPGSGGPDWLRGDIEFVICTSRPGKLPWSDSTAMGHPPKWAPGGEMSYRLSDGTRRNQWGGGEKSSGNERLADGNRRKAGRPSHKIKKVGTRQMGPTRADGKVENQGYSAPTLANPGNRIQYTPSEYEIISFLEEYSNATGKNADEVVRSLQEAIRAQKTSMWCVGAAAQIQGSTILQSSMHGGSQGDEIDNGENVCEGKVQGTEDVQGKKVPQMRNNREPSQTPYRRGPDEQQSEERGDSLSVLSHSAPQPDTRKSLPDMRATAPFVRLVRCSLLPLQEAWRSAEEISQQSLWYRGVSSNLISVPVGGGLMGGDEFASQNEAPYPMKLCEFFILSFCQPGGRVLDPTCGSSTTGAVAIQHQREYIGIDIRPAQIELSRKRLETVTPNFPCMV